MLDSSKLVPVARQSRDSVGGHRMEKKAVGRNTNLNLASYPMQGSQGEGKSTPKPEEDDDDEVHLKPKVQIFGGSANGEVETFKPSSMDHMLSLSKHPRNEYQAATSSMPVPNDLALQPADPVQVGYDRYRTHCKMPAQRKTVVFKNSQLDPRSSSSSAKRRDGGQKSEALRPNSQLQPFKEKDVYRKVEKTYRDKLESNSKEMLIPTQRYQQEQLLLNSFDKPAAESSQGQFFAMDPSSAPGHQFYSNQINTTSRRNGRALSHGNNLSIQELSVQIPT